MKPLARPAPLASRAETLRQAIQWDAVKQRYLRAGCCEACAAQASWGHALGWGFRSDHPWPPEIHRARCTDQPPQWPGTGHKEWALL